MTTNPNPKEDTMTRIFTHDELTSLGSVPHAYNIYAGITKWYDPGDDSSWYDMSVGAFIHEGYSVVDAFTTLLRRVRKSIPRDAEPWYVGNRHVQYTYYRGSTKVKLAVTVYNNGTCELVQTGVEVVHHEATEAYDEEIPQFETVCS